MKRTYLIILLLVKSLLSEAGNSTELFDILSKVNARYYSKDKLVSLNYTLKYHINKEVHTANVVSKMSAGNYNIKIENLSTICANNLVVQIDQDEKQITVANTSFSNDNPMNFIQSFTQDDFKAKKYKIIPIGKSKFKLRLYADDHMVGKADSTDFVILKKDYRMEKIISYINPEYDFVNNELGNESCLEIIFNSESITLNRDSQDMLKTINEYIFIDHMNQIHLLAKYKTFTLIDLRKKL